MKLIDKDALVAEIERIYNEGYKFLPSDIAENIQNFKDDVLINIDTLKVKEVELEKEIETCLKRHSMLAVGKKDFTDIAKHFFKLGLSASNQITAADRGIAYEIILALKAFGEEKMISYDKEIEWIRNKVKKGE